MKRLVEAHGGKVSCETELGVGSTFTLTLTLPRRAPVIAGEPSEEPHEADPP